MNAKKSERSLEPDMKMDPLRLKMTAETFFQDNGFQVNSPHDFDFQFLDNLISDERGRLPFHALQRTTKQ